MLLTNSCPTINLFYMQRMNTEEVYREIVKDKAEELDALKGAVLAYEVERFRNEVLTSLATIDELISHVCKTRMITKDSLVGRTRKRGVVETRQIIWYLLKNKVVRNSLTLQQLGEMFGRDHATTLWGVRKIEMLMVYDRNIREEVMIISNKFGKPTRWDTVAKVLSYDPED